jgi:hypothetical protein
LPTTTTTNVFVVKYSSDGTAVLFQAAVDSYSAAKSTGVAGVTIDSSAVVAGYFANSAPTLPLTIWSDPNAGAPAAVRAREGCGVRHAACCAAAAGGCAGTGAWA